MEKIYRVLILCTGNSARSVMAEGLFNILGKGRFQAFSAGSQPTGKVNPFALEILQKNGYDISALRSKSWDEFAQADAPVMDFIFTVCDNAAGEACPIWLGHPQTGHWGFTDPAAVEGSDAEKRAAFSQIYRQIARRIELFINLPLEKLDRQAIKQEIEQIGSTSPSL